jgi:hypothetical protein
MLLCKWQRILILMSFSWVAVVPCCNFLMSANTKIERRLSVLNMQLTENFLSSFVVGREFSIYQWI